MINIKIKNKKLNSKIKSGFAPLVLVIIIGIVLAAGGLGLGLAWRAGLIGKPGGGPGDGTTTNGTQPPPSNGEEDPTKDWQTYSSAQYEYSFKYPSNWILHLDSAEEIRLSDPSNAAIGGIRLNDPDVTMLIQLFYESSGDKDPERFIRDIIGRYSDPTEFPVVVETATIAGRAGVKALDIGPGMLYDVREVFYVVTNNGIGFYFSAAADVDNEGQTIDSSDVTELEILDLIVSTFRFAK